jgi:HPt (histidine-containing phosphotransfer) domain-containing protein
MNAEKTQPPILKAEALERLGGEEDFLDELLKLYRKEFAAQRRAMRNAFSKRDMPSLRELGHALKGASANLSLPGMREAAAALETAGREDDLAAARAALARLDAEFARLRAFLR